MAKKRLNVVKRKKNDILKIFHAPNHKNLKGSYHLIQAVDELKKEGYKIELTLMEKVSNEEILDAICAADIIVDQLIIGWYGMFALEAMALGKPVICFIEENFEKLYISAGLLEHDELPVIKSSVFDIKNTLKNILKSKIDIYAIGEKSKAFVEKNHSIEAIGKIFDNINKIVLSRK
jgi:glycosyltransferase involved in cell wall biosynthesis